MITTSICQHCSRLPPPPPIFSVSPPPNILSVDIRCSSRLLSSSSSSIQHKKLTSSLSLPIAMGILIAFLISTGTILLIKNRMIKRRQRKYDDRSLSVKFNGHNHQENRTKFIPLLSDSCSSDHTSSTPASEYPPCGIIESFYPNNIHHEYEQINYDNNSSHYYCLIYCRQCGNYHQTSRTYSCTCHLRNAELQPILKTNSDDLNH